MAQGISPQEQETLRRPRVIIKPAQQSPEAPTSSRQWLAWMFTRYDVLLICGVMVIAAIIDFQHLGERSIWYDEGVSVDLAYVPWTIWWGWIWGPLQNMALYYLLLRAWLAFTALFGMMPTEAVVRIPSAILAVMSTGVVFAFGRRFANSLVGLLAALLFTVNLVQINYAQEARAYSLHLLLICVGWFALFSALGFVSHAPRQTRADESMSRKRGGAWLRAFWRRQGWWVLYTLTMALAIYGHLISVFDVMGQATAVGVLALIPNDWRSLARAGLRKTAVSVCGVIVLALPILYDSYRNGGGSDWIPVPKLSALLAFFTSDIVGLHQPFAILLYCLIVSGIVIALLARISPLRERLSLAQTTAAENSAVQRPIFQAQSLSLCIALLCWFIVPVVLAYLASIQPLNQHVFLLRYQIAAIPAFCLLMALGVVTFRGWLVRGVLIGALLFFGFRSVAAEYTSDQQHQTFGVVADWLERNYQPGDGIICLTQAACSVPYSYYFERKYAGQPAQFMQDSPGYYSWIDNGGVAMTLANVQAYSATHKRVFILTDELVQFAGHSPAAIQIGDWLSAHYTLVSSATTSVTAGELYQAK